ncbi:lysosomal alpha-glucosidase-like [Cloeon dipterum]|uniref:lysosomal alpha-glucosidase-like n=1 Tax=Cloeon dipterum TaxID=197152 RepID=UPI00321F6AEA
MRDSVKNLLRQIKDLRGGGSFKSNGSNAADISQDFSSHEESRISDREPISTASDLNRVDLSNDPDFDPFPDEEEILTGNSKRCLIIVGSLFIVCCLALPTAIIAHHMLSSKNLSHSYADCKFFGDLRLQNKYLRKKLAPTNYDEIEEPLALPVEKETKVLKAPTAASFCTGIPPARMFDCYPESGATKDKCEARGCCWMPRRPASKGNQGLHKSLEVPYCFYPQNFGGYKYVNVTEAQWGLTAYMQREFFSPYPDDVPLLRMDIKMESKERLRIKIYDPYHQRFEPPYPEVPKVKGKASKRDYDVVIDPAKFGFKIVRKKTNCTIFDTASTEGFTFANQFIQISSLLPTHLIYGLGEHRSTLRLSTHWERFTLFTHDSVPQERTNLYGSHPFYLMLEESGKSHGVFLLNSNAMDVILQPAPAITFRTIGGILDFFFFLGPNPADVISQYTEVIGRPYMPPYWGLGYHQCRFGYKTLAKTKEVLQRTIDAGIPIDTQWNDLDYMQRGNDFTWDSELFAKLPEFVDDLHKAGRHYVPLIDAGIASGEPKGSYAPYDRGMELDIFVKNQSGLPFVGKVWNKYATVWPDFTNPNTVDYWLNELGRLHSLLKFDGAWIDMNEPSNFYDGQKDGCPDNQWENPPYLPAVQGGKLSYKTMCMSAIQFAGMHYDVHNLFGYTESIVTSFAMAEIRERRPFVISRSTFAGQGHFAGHWSGDVASTWYDMRKTLPQLLSFSMFGVPLMGADICGFNGNTTAALCQRWVQLGAFYPFSRNHNTDDGIDQDPVSLGPEVAESARVALKIRYSLLPYLYGLFWQATISGTTVARPLFFEYPHDTQTHDIDEQFLWGSAIMFVPVLDEGKTTVSAYLPKGSWYDFYNLQLLQADVGTGEWRQLQAPLGIIPILLRGGNVIPMQAANLTTTDSRKNPVELLVVPDVEGSASGIFYWDDGDSLNTFVEGHYSLANFTSGWGWFQSTPQWWGYQEKLTLGKVTFLDVASNVTSVTLNGKAAAFTCVLESKLLIVHDINIALSYPISIHWK